MGLPPTTPQAASTRNGVPTSAQSPAASAQGASTSRDLGSGVDLLQCQWCGKPVEYSGRGRKPRFCSQSCKQRAYEQRTAGKGKGISDDAIILGSSKAQTLKDSLFELKCAAEDIKMAASEGADSSEIVELADDLISVAARIEAIRTDIERPS